MRVRSVDDLRVAVVAVGAVEAGGEKQQVGCEGAYPGEHVFRDGGAEARAAAPVLALAGGAAVAARGAHPERLERHWLGLGLGLGLKP